MQPFGILVAIIILIIGVVSQNKYRVPQKTSESVLSTKIEISPTRSPSPTQQPTHMPTVIVTLVPPSPTSSASNRQPTDLQTFRYPAASEVSSDANSMHLTSTDSADAITSWYKSKIKEGGYNTTAFAVTNTNGNVLTKLAGANGHTEIRVEITKSSGDVSTQIAVTLRTY
jgi:hypothetical protein